MVSTVTELGKLQIEVIRSWRRSFSVQVVSSDQLLVRAPMMARKADIDVFLQKEQAWLKKKLRELRENEQAIKPLTFRDGELFYLWGRQVRLQQVDQAIIHESPDGNTLFIGKAWGRKELCDWLVSRLQAYLTQQVGKYARLMGLPVPEFRIAQGHSRWGYCNYKDRLGFNWHLVFCPPACIDYVIVHELSHIRHKNHQKAFWAEVEAVLPDRKQRERWLTVNGRVMVQL